MYTIEDFNLEKEAIMMKTIFGEPRDFSKLREICRNLGVNYDFKVDSDDATFWQACCQYTNELVKNS